MKKVNNKTK